MYETLAILRLSATNIILGGVALVIAFGISFKARLVSRLASFIPSVEGFKGTPYWDQSRYSWGYGTAAPGPYGTISRDQAFADMLTYLLNDYATLKNKITRSLTVRQWAALLSFSYNLGVGDALKLVPLINAGDDGALGDKWGQYVYAGAAVSDTLVDRRQREWDLWIS